MAQFTQESVLGAKIPRIVPSKARHLTSKVKRICKKYIEDLEGMFKKYKVLERLKELEQTATFPVSQEAKQAMENLDQEMSKLMLQAEKGCRKLHASHYDFSPDVKLWLDKCHSYRALIKLQNKFEKIGSRDPKKLEDGNPANIYRAARRCGIQDPQTIGLKELYLRYKDCKEHARKMMADSPWMRRTFLSTKLREAIDKKDKENETAIKQVLRSEAEKREWNGINATTKPNKTGIITHVDVKRADGSIKRCDTKESCEEAVHGEIKPRFSRASSAPVCQGALFGLHGYEVDSKIAMQILEGTFDYYLITDSRLNTF